MNMIFTSQEHASFEVKIENVSLSWQLIYI